MAKSPEKIIVEAQNIAKVQTMIELLDKYKDDLPVELMDSLNELADCDACEYGVGSLAIFGCKPCDVECFIDGKKVNGIVSANIILKRITVYPRAYDSNKDPEHKEGGFVESHRYPDNFAMKDMVGNELLGWN